MPSHPVARALLRAFGGGIAAPSANRFGRISPTTAQHVADDLGDAVALILDGGACAVGIESTIVAFAGDDPVLLRPGGIAVARSAARAGARAARAGRRRPARIGNARLALRAAGRRPTWSRADALRAEICSSARATRSSRCSRARSRGPPDFAGVWLRAPADAAAYAHDLYANLRALDAANADVILIEAVPDDDGWLAVRDRLERATRGVDDDRD